MTKNRTTRVQPTTSQFHVYVMRAERVDPAITWDVYVGSTGLDLHARWQRYEQLAASVSVHFRKGRVRALGYAHHLCQGWGPYATRDEARVAEGELAAALQEQGYAVYSDRLPRASSRSLRSRSDA